jgi:hypothetical protein
MFEGIFGKKKNVTNENAAYHITITNKKTGEVEYDEDTNVILGAFDKGTESSGFALAAANAVTCAAVLASARKAIEGFAKEHPQLELILGLAEMKRKEPADESEDTAE